jgi:3-methylcrotonyl-CoA carboxylase alpha subunit
MIKRLLIANRGEIACRIIKTCQKLGITAICVYADSDRDAPFVKKADEAYPLEGESSLETYLNQDKLLALCEAKNIDAIHPGYGFLSENAEFAAKVIKANRLFIGPKPEAIELMGSKAEAKAIAEKLSVPTIPGYHGKNQDLKTLKDKACEIGFPLLIKASFGGGGKGMRIATNADELEELIAGAKRESAKSFARDELILEKYLVEPRHIEVQIVRDNHGNCLHFFDRDCSIQRRHQKVVEEAPALGLSKALKDKMSQYAINLSNGIDYQSAGTIEFLVCNDEIYFIEMNTRLQVEHPVTELISGVDLVELQIQVANNEALPIVQNSLTATGHAIEVRLYAEDPENDFLPATGVINTIELPEESERFRLDGNLKEGLSVTHHFDPMLAKLICYGKSRLEALCTLKDVLENSVILGVKTNLAYLHALIADLIDSQKLPSTEHISKTPPSIVDKSALAYALFAISRFQELTHSENPWVNTPGWQLNLNQAFKLTYQINQQAAKTLSLVVKDDGYQITLEQEPLFVLQQVTENNGKLSASLNNQRVSARLLREKDTIIINGKPYAFTKPSPLAHQKEDSEASLNAPMPGTVVAIHVKEKEPVKNGQVLAILEAMKMEHQIRAPSDGFIRSIHYQEGQTVNEGDPLFELEG